MKVSRRNFMKSLAGGGLTILSFDILKPFRAAHSSVREKIIVPETIKPIRDFYTTYINGHPVVSCDFSLGMEVIEPLYNNKFTLEPSPSCGKLNFCCMEGELAQSLKSSVINRNLDKLVIERGRERYEVQGLTTLLTANMPIDEPTSYDIEITLSGSMVIL